MSGNFKFDEAENRYIWGGNMTKPEMIIFDYGYTILHEPNNSAENGNKAIYKYIKDNPDNVSFETFNKTCIEMFAEIKANRGTLEIHEHHYLRLLYDYLNITLSVSIAEAECIIWNGISEGAVMPYVLEMLDYLNENGIRTAVISNLAFSGAALAERIDRLLPNNQFEFVLASSEYVFKKPHPLMFKVALNKAGLAADKRRPGNHMEGVDAPLGGGAVFLHTGGDPRGSIR